MLFHINFIWSTVLTIYIAFHSLCNFITNRRLPQAMNIVNFVDYMQLPQAMNHHAALLHGDAIGYT